LFGVVRCALGSIQSSGTTFKDFKGTEKTFGDYAGFKASRNLPSNFPKTAAVVNGLTTQQSISAIKSLNNDFQVYNTTALPGQNYQLSFGRVKDFEKTANRFGAIFSISYRNSQITNPEVDKELFNQFKYVDQTYKFSTSLGVLANFAYFFGKSKITLKNVFNRIQDDQYVYRSGSNLNTSTFNKFFAFDLIQKTLLKSTLMGSINWVNLKPN
jgi:hypothetical protein